MKKNGTKKFVAQEKQLKLSVSSCGLGIKRNFLRMPCECKNKI